MATDKNNFKNRKYDVFTMFDKGWALATAGTIDNYNTCTIGWGSLGDIWKPTNQGRPIVTIYINELRYTNEFLMNNDYFTVSFFPEEYRKDLAYLGSHSGRNEDKVSKTDLTPISIEHGVTFKEAKLTFVCRKLYWDKYSLDQLDPEIVSELYTTRPPHYEYIGEIVDVIEKEKTPEEKREEDLSNGAPFDIGDPNPSGAHFTGKSYVKMLAEDQGVGAMNVTFEPGCRNWWHIHHGRNQILLCTAGEGWYQEEGKPAQRLKPGDVVNIPTEVKHWHGAVKDSWFSHVVPGIHDPNATVTWCEPVTDEEYEKLED